MNMTEPDSSSKELVEKTAVVDSWIAKISGEGIVGEEVTPEILRTVLEQYSADFEPKPELGALAKYSNLNKRPGLDAVWGKTNVDAFKTWAKEVCVLKYEQKYGHELPTLYDRKTNTFDNIKHSGMMQFLGELTAFAADKISFEDYKRLTENRARKGKEWQDRKAGDVYEPSPNAAFLPEFATDAWNFIKSGFTTN